MSSVQFVLCCYVGFDLRCLSHSLRFSSLAQIFYWCRIIRRRGKNQEKDKMEKDNTLFVRLSYIHLRSYYIVCIFFPFEGITIHLSLSNSLSLRIGSDRSWDGNALFLSQETGDQGCKKSKKMGEL